MLSVLSSAKALYVRLQQMGQATNLDAGTYIYSHCFIFHTTSLIYLLCTRYACFCDIYNVAREPII